MRPVVGHFRAPPGGTLAMGLVLYGRDPRTGTVAPLPRPGDVIEWTVEWPRGGDEVLTQLSAPNALRVDRRTGIIAFPVSAERQEDMAAASAPAPTRVRLLLPDGSAYPILVGSVAFGDPVPMQTAPALFEALTVPSIDVLPRVEPYLVGLVLSYPLGAADQAVADAAAKVADLLAQPDLGAALVDAPIDLTDASPRAANTAFVQGVARAIVDQAREIAAAAIADLMTTPGKLRDMLPTDATTLDPGTPYRVGDTIAFVPDPNGGA